MLRRLTGLFYNAASTDTKKTNDPETPMPSSMPTHIELKEEPEIIHMQDMGKVEEPRSLTSLNSDDEEKPSEEMKKAVTALQGTDQIVKEILDEIVETTVKNTISPIPPETKTDVMTAITPDTATTTTRTHMAPFEINSELSGGVVTPPSSRNPATYSKRTFAEQMKYFLCCCKHKEPQNNIQAMPENILHTMKVR